MEGDWLKCRTGPPLFQVIKNSLALTFTLACSSWNSVACISTLHLLELALADLFKYQASQSLNSHLVPDEIKLCYLCSNMLSLWHAVMSFWQRLPRAHQPVCSFCSSMITIFALPLSPQRPQVGLSAWVLAVASHLWTRISFAISVTTHLFFSFFGLLFEDAACSSACVHPCSRSGHLSAL